MSKKVLIATGGTGGHIYPAIALAQQIMAEIPNSDVLFVGGGLAKNKYFDHKTFDYRNIACGSFVKKSPGQVVCSFSNIARGIWQSCNIIREFRPDVAVGFGSFYAFPPLVAAKLMSVPIVLHEANSIPGKVNRYLSSWAEVTAVHFPETQHLLKGPSVEVGMPLRDGFRHASIPREEAIRHFGLDPERKTLLVFGGSQGATSINRLVEGAVGQLNLQNFQILHIAGDVNILDELETFYATKNIRACVKPFENRMELAWQAAHIVICRAGAGAVAEQMEFEVPGILIPFPHAADNHQEHNADFMCATVGGAVKLLEKDLTASRLAACISDLWNDQEGILTRMQQAMQHYKKRARSRDLCALIKDYLLSY